MIHGVKLIDIAVYIGIALFPALPTVQFLTVSHTIKNWTVESPKNVASNYKIRPQADSFDREPLVP